jgi:hypothetical protein
MNGTYVTDGLLQTKQIVGRKIAADIDVLCYVCTAMHNTCEAPDYYEIDAGPNQPFE